MGIINIVKTVKKIHSNSIIMIKIGNFYHVYGKDAYILSALFEYKIKEIENTITCGFNEKGLSKISAKLEEKKINYIILDRRNNYEVDERVNFKNLNSYDKIYKQSKEKVEINRRIEKINAYLKNNYNNPKIKQALLEIEVVISENRKL